MAKMHSRRRGKSGSTKPIQEEAPKWVDMSPKEVEEKIKELYEKEENPSDIGRILRDRYGVPDVKTVTGKKISEILEKVENPPEYPEDLMNLMKKAVRLRKHLNNNNKDIQNKRAVRLTESKVRRLVKYYKKKGELEQDWFYTPEKAKLIVEE